MAENRKRSWGALLFGGIVSVLFGIVALIWPGKTLLVVIAFFGVFILAESVVTIVVTIARRKQYERWWIGLIGGVLGLIIGGIAAFRPIAATVVLLYLIAA
jgi:uncharacterized membrane protein HdeD (DUF308 family)